MRSCFLRQQGSAAIVLVFSLAVNMYLIQERCAAQPVAFEYGIVARKAADLDSLFSVADGIELHSGDQIRITVRRMMNTFLYVILQMSNGEYSLFHTVPLGDRAIEETESLRWLRLDDEKGVETIHLLVSNESLIGLENALSEYGISRGARRDVLAEQIASHFQRDAETGIDGGDKLLPLARVDTRSHVGWNYRGPYDEQNNSIYVFSHCSGDTIATERIRIIHR